MIEIVFEPHATTFDNETKRVSGWNDVELSPLGVQQAKELGQRRSLDDFDAVFCSDLKRAYKTATIAFGENANKIFIDWRLRECNYGDFTGRPSKDIEAERPNRIDQPFPNGESYSEIVIDGRMFSFFGDLARRWEEKKVFIIGHRATHYALDYHTKDMPLEEAVTQKFIWQPGWEYKLE